MLGRCGEGSCHLSFCHSNMALMLPRWSWSPSDTSKQSMDSELEAMVHLWMIFMVIYRWFACHRWFSLSKIVNKFKNSSCIYIYISEWFLMYMLECNLSTFCPGVVIWTSSNVSPAMGVLPSDHVDTHQPQEELSQLSVCQRRITCLVPWWS